MELGELKDCSQTPLKATEGLRELAELGELKGCPQARSAQGN